MPFLSNALKNHANWSQNNIEIPLLILKKKKSKTAFAAAKPQIFKRQDKKPHPTVSVTYSDPF